MAQQLIDVGTVANDRTGDTWRDAFIKVNSNETELFDFKDAQAFIFITKESDFPTQDATTITLESNMIYIPTQDFSTGKRFVCQEGSVYSSFNPLGPITTYTGTGSMFTGTNISCEISSCRIDAPNASQAFDFSDTGAGIRLSLMIRVVLISAIKWGTFTNITSVQITECSCLAISDGITVVGTVTNLLTIEKVAFISTSASFIGLDLGSSVINNIDMINFIVVAPAGAFGISGLAASANVTIGFIALVGTSTFVGGLTPLQNITSSDIRWKFSGNAGIADTISDGLLSFVGNATETVISVMSTPVIVNATWTVIRTSQFTGTTGGRLTYDGERDLQSPIDISAGLISSGGGAIDVQLCIALNGTVITETCTPISISGANPQTLSIPWQLVLEEDDFLEVFVQNDTNTTNIIVEYCRLRVR